LTAGHPTGTGEGHQVRIAVIGSGFIGGVLTRGLVAAGRDVVVGSRHPDPAGAHGAASVSVGEALAAADVVVLAVPGTAVAEIVAAHGDALAGTLVVDATNRMGAPVANARADLPAEVRYARAFNTLGGEVMAEPRFAAGPVDLFFSAPEADRGTVEALVTDLGLHPVYLGADREDLADALFRVWIALAIEQGHGRRLALRVETA
jgi:8-hydroxy-5-deazaflavin:NADPH oxidoreductase